MSSSPDSVSLLASCIQPPHFLPVFHLPFLLQISPLSSSSSLSFLLSFPSRGPGLAKCDKICRKGDVGSSQALAGFVRLEQSSHLSVSWAPQLQREGEGNTCCFGGLGTGFGAQAAGSPSLWGAWGCSPCCCRCPLHSARVLLVLQHLRDLRTGSIFL